MENIIDVQNLVKTFEHIKAVDNISFQVKPGEFFGFLGVNGAGKSTTINMLCTLFAQTSGSAQICGYSLGKNNEAIRRKIGIVFQNNTLDSLLTVKENLISRAYLYENNSKKVKENIKRISTILEINDLLGKKFKDLSGGQKRRCEVARALLHNPEILFLDEPTTGLDPKTKQLVWKCIASLRENFNTTVFLTTHYMEEAAMAEHIVVLDKGHIIADASPFQLKTQYSYDRLRLEVLDEPEVYRILDTFNLQATKTSNCLEVKLPDSLYAIHVLTRLEKFISTFELLQGTMDDVFLNLTNATIKGGEGL